MSTKSESLPKTKRPSLFQRGLGHVMNGVGYMIPVVMGGGILLAISFIVDDASIDPTSVGTNTELARLFNAIGVAAFSFMLPILAAFIGHSIAGNAAIVVGLTGGYLAVAGGSGFLGALFAGFLAGGIILLLRQAVRWLPDTFDGIKTMLIYPVFGVLLIGLSMQFLINPPGHGINEALTSLLNSMSGASVILLGAIVGAMMSVDMGGPVNKTAYLAATAALATGEYSMMAAVMVGGMVPPLVSAVSTTIAKKKFTQEERQRGITNYVMGGSFISEGAIPFAAADPLRFIPACIVGSAAGGALSMAFGCSVMAPAGGLWVVALVTNPLGWVASIVAGVAVATAIYVPLKKAPTVTEPQTDSLAQ